MIYTNTIKIHKILITHYIDEFSDFNISDGPFSEDIIEVFSDTENIKEHNFVLATVKYNSGKDFLIKNFPDIDPAIIEENEEIRR